LYLQFDEYINSKEKKVSKATICVYNCMKKHLQGFEEFRKKKIGFDSFDYVNTIKDLAESLKSYATRQRTANSGFLLCWLNNIFSSFRLLIAYIMVHVRKVRQPTVRVYT
jgi:hypothetical protein